MHRESFTRRYEMVRDTVTDRAPRAFKEQALGSRRAERASEPRKGRPQRASEPNTKPGGVRVVCALRFFMCTKRIFKISSGATRARSLCFIHAACTFWRVVVSLRRGAVAAALFLSCARATYHALLGGVARRGAHFLSCARATYRAGFGSVARRAGAALARTSRLVRGWRLDKCLCTFDCERSVSKK